MYRIPKDLNLSPVIGQFTTQVHVGQFDLQFEFGAIKFAVQSPVKLIRNGAVIGEWSEGKWPDAHFLEIMNVNIENCETPNDKTIILYFENGIEMHLVDNSDQYECMQISIDGEQNQWII